MTEKTENLSKLTKAVLIKRIEAHEHILAHKEELRRREKIGTEYYKGLYKDEQGRSHNWKYAYIFTLVSFFALLAIYFT